MAWPTTVLGIVVEINVWGLGWTNITADVRRDDGNGVRITDGVTSHESRRAAPSRCTFQLDNRDGKYSPRNPASPYYRLLKLNTEIRVTIEGEGQFWGEVSSAWPTVWTPGAPSSGDAWVPIEAQGRSRRDNADTEPMDAPLYSEVIGAGPYFYWPLDDPEGSVRGRQAGSVDDAPDLMPSGNLGPEFAATSGPLGGANVAPVFDGSGALIADLPGGQLGIGGFTVACWFKIATGDTTGIGTIVPWQIDMTPGSGGSTTLYAADLWMQAGLGAGTPGEGRVSFSLGVYTNYPPTTRSSDLVVVASSAVAAQGVWHEVRATFEQTSGTVVTASVYLNGVLLGSDTNSAGTYVMGPTTRIMVNPTNGKGSYTVASGKGLESLSNIALYPGATDPDTYTAGLGFPGEKAGTRLARICATRGIGLTLVGSAADTVAMGPQTSGTTLSAQLEDCATADGGLLYDSRTALEYVYRTRASLYNQTASLALDYTLTAEVKPSLRPDDSDLVVTNSVTATGPPGKVTVEAGFGETLNTGEPSGGPDNVGRYPLPISLNVNTLGDLTDAANWKLRQGTIDLPRFDSITVNLRHMAVAGKTALWQAAAGLAFGDLITIANTPIWIPDDIQAFAVGRTLRAANFEYDITYSTEQADGWLNIGGPLEDTVLGRLDSEDSFTVGAITSGATSMLVYNQSDEATATLWTHADGDYHVRLDDEEVNVTNVAFVTPTGVVNGTPAYADNASVTPGLPGGGTSAGHLLLLFAATRRNDGTSAPQLPSGWTAISGVWTSNNAMLAYRIFTGTESAPTVTFTGGSAGDTHGAVIVSFAGIARRVLYAAGGSGTAQDMVAPAAPVTRDGVIVMWLGWKADDWTSVATLSGATEAIDSSSTLGSDLGLVWDYRTLLTRADQTAQTFVVTGGAAAAYGTAVLVFDGNIQTFTITRGQHGTTAAAHAEQIEVRLAHPLILGR
ncbi:MAG: hypothetical protein ABW046_22480 [Actinoplanes sp.]